MKISFCLFMSNPFVKKIDCKQIPALLGAMFHKKSLGVRACRRGKMTPSSRSGANSIKLFQHYAVT